jgi:hypothetical protein
LCIGQAAVHGLLAAASGQKDMRFALPMARIMLHQPSGGFQGQANRHQLHAQEILNIKKRLNEIYVKHTGSTQENRGCLWELRLLLTMPELAKEWGVIDKVLDKRAEEPTDKVHKVGWASTVVPQRGKELGVIFRPRGMFRAFMCRPRGFPEGQSTSTAYPRPLAKSWGNTL